MIKSVDDVIEVLGGTGKTAAISRVGATAVCNWRTRGEIPPEHFLLISGALAAIGERADISVFGFKVQEGASCS
jgi:hypothetical protein